RDIAEDQNRPNRFTFLVLDRRGTIFYGVISAILADEYRVIGKRDGLPGQRLFNWIGDFLAGSFVDDLKDLAEVFTDRILLAPARQAFSDGVHEVNAPGCIC